MKTNTPNPLVPQGTFSDPKAKSNLRMTVFLIIAGHIVLISGLLMAGCKKTAETPPDQNLITSPFDTNPVPQLTPATVPTTPSNPIPVEPSNPPPLVTQPIPGPTPTSAALEGEREHTVVAKDSFYTLAKKYNVTMKAIELANPGVDSKRLKLGQKLKIPAPTGTAKTASLSPAVGENGEKIHAVKSGERLLTIAKDEGTTVKAIKALNSLRTDRITVGQKLKIPAKTAAASAAPAGAETTPASVPMTPLSAPVTAPGAPSNP